MDRLSRFSQFEKEVLLGLQSHDLRRVAQTKTEAARIELEGRKVGWFTRRLRSVRESVNGEAWELTLLSREKIAVKLAPFFRANAFEEGRGSNCEPWRELALLERCTALFKETGLPQLPLLFGHGLCKGLGEGDYGNPRFRERLRRENTGKALFLYNELCETDLSTWVRTGLPKVEDCEDALMAALFQIFASLQLLQSRLGLVHFDLIPGNVLVSSVEPGYWQYKLGDQRWLVPNHGLAFIPWDFSKGVLLGEDTPELVVARALSYEKRSLKVEVPGLKEAIHEQPGLAILKTIDVCKIARNLKTVLVNYGPKDLGVDAVIGLLKGICDQASVDFVQSLESSEMMPATLLRRHFGRYLGVHMKCARVLNAVPFNLGS